MLRLNATEFNPSRGEAPDIPPGLAIRGYAEGVSGYYIVQFEGPIRPEWRQALAGAGAQVLGYLPDFAFKVRMTPAQARRADAMAGVAFVGLFHPAYKFSPGLQRDGTAMYRVRLAEGADAETASSDIAAAGVQILKRDGLHLTVAADSGQLDALAHVLDGSARRHHPTWLEGQPVKVTRVLRNGGLFRWDQDAAWLIHLCRIPGTHGPSFG
jgi:hypothetical protein